MNSIEPVTMKLKFVFFQLTDVAMAFKVPLPKVAKNQHPHERETEPYIGLPGFNKSDLLNMTLIGQGAFGKVFKCIKDNITFVMKQIDGRTDNAETQQQETLPRIR
jgi:hypothetical protein